MDLISVTWLYPTALMLSTINLDEIMILKLSSEAVLKFGASLLYNETRTKTIMYSTYLND